MPSTLELINFKKDILKLDGVWCWSATNLLYYTHTCLNIRWPAHLYTLSYLMTTSPPSCCAGWCTWLTGSAPSWDWLDSQYLRDSTLSTCGHPSQGGVWHVTCDVWHVKLETGYLIHNMSNIKCHMWHDYWHVTYVMRHVTYDFLQVISSPPSQGKMGITFSAEFSLNKSHGRFSL